MSIGGDTKRIKGTGVPLFWYCGTGIMFKCVVRRIIIALRKMYPDDISRSYGPGSITVTTNKPWSVGGGKVNVPL